MALPKRYETVARLGWTSTTGDPEGELAPGRTPRASRCGCRPAGSASGRRPTPRSGSAGARAYALARAGEAVEVPEREVDVHRFEQRWRDGERAGFAIECGSGTYVRSLIADLGDAYCLELRRTRIGPFDVADAGRFVPLGRGARLPARGRAARRGGAAGGARGGRRRAAPDGTARLVDDGRA